MGFVHVTKVSTENLRCPYCLDRYDEHDGVECNRCRTQMHRECWYLNGGCPTFLCRGEISLASVPWEHWDCFEQKVALAFPELTHAFDDEHVGFFTRLRRGARRNEPPFEVVRTFCVWLYAQRLTAATSRSLAPRVTDRWSDSPPNFRERVDVRLLSGTARQLPCPACDATGKVRGWTFDVLLRKSWTRVM